MSIKIVRLKINTSENSLVHFDFNKQDYTLCGLEIAGDSELKISAGIKTNRKVNCPDCTEVVLFCKKIKSTEYKIKSKHYELI